MLETVLTVTAAFVLGLGAGYGLGARRTAARFRARGALQADVARRILEALRDVRIADLAACRKAAQN